MARTATSLLNTTAHVANVYADGGVVDQVEFTNKTTSPVIAAWTDPATGITTPIHVGPGQTVRKPVSGSTSTGVFAVGPGTLRVGANTYDATLGNA